MEDKYKELAKQIEKNAKLIQKNMKRGKGYWVHVTNPDLLKALGIISKDK